MEARPIQAIVEVRDAVRGVIAEQYNNVVGHTDVFIEGRRGKVRTEETNLGNLTADANKWYAEGCEALEDTKVLSLKNGGGIRAEIGDFVVNEVEQVFNPPANDGLETAMPGDVSEGHFRGTLRFDNGLVVLDVTGTELKTLLEHAVAATAAGVLPGRFPQVAGISFGFDPTKKARSTNDEGAVDEEGERITDLYVDTEGDGAPETALYVNGVEQAAAAETYTLVTLNFLANGGDGYPFASLSAPNRRQLYEGAGFGDDEAPGFPFTQLENCDPGQLDSFSKVGNEQEALGEFFQEFHPNPDNAFDTAETAPEDDRRIQNLEVVGDFITPDAQ